MKNILVIMVIVLSLSGPACADRGPVLWQADVTLTQESQKAIILHNASEEVLILGTELKASRETDVLEFIPFPSEPGVFPAKGNSFEEAIKLIAKKELTFQFFEVSKHAGGEITTVPVEIRLSEKIGAHDVTVIKINSIDQFSGWLENFFKSKGIQTDSEKLSHVYNNALDYMKRGFNYFVFDYVRITGKTKFIEPLVYRFKTGKIYYPLKTSNLIGGRGVVEMILILPGSVTDDIWQHVRRIFPVNDNISINLSSSSKVYPEEVEALYPSGPFFGKRSRIYMQVLKYEGPYSFKDDFTYDIAGLVPYARKHEVSDRTGIPWSPGPSLTPGEKRDLREALCQGDDLKHIFAIRDYGIDCIDFIPNAEYEVYAALFKKDALRGVPSGNVVIERNTIRKELRNKKIDKALVKDFNDKNRITYTLENAFPGDDKLKISIRGNGQASPARQTGRIYVSRVGFNQNGTKSLVYVDYIAGPRSGGGYQVVLEMKNGEWEISESVMDTIY